MKVRAKERGFCNSRLYEPGEEFEIPDNSKPGKWMDVLEKPAEEKAVKPKAEKPAEEKAVK